MVATPLTLPAAKIVRMFYWQSVGQFAASFGAESRGGILLQLIACGITLRQQAVQPVSVWASHTGPDGTPKGAHIT
jgi:hypothetical protein